MYLALGWAGGILCVLFYAYDYIIFSYIAFFFAVAGFVIHHKESNKYKIVNKKKEKYYAKKN